MTPDEATLILVDTFKGGVGKTTTSLWLSRSLADLGYPTLLVGLSPQNDLIPIVASRYAGIRDVCETKERPSVIEVAPRFFHVPAGRGRLPEEDPGMGRLIREVAASRGCRFAVVDGLCFHQDAPWWVLDDADAIVVPATPYAEAVAGALRTITAIPHYQRNFKKALRVRLASLLLVAVPSPSRCPRSSIELMAALRASEYAGFVMDSEVRWSSQRRPGAQALVPIGSEQMRTELASSRLASDYRAVAEELCTRLGIGKEATVDAG